MAKEVLVGDREEWCMQKDLTKQEDDGEYQLNEKNYTRNDMYVRFTFTLRVVDSTYTGNGTFCG